MDQAKSIIQMEMCQFIEIVSGKSFRIIFSLKIKYKDKQIFNFIHKEAKRLELDKIALYLSIIKTETNKLFFKILLKYIIIQKKKLFRF